MPVDSEAKPPPVESVPLGNIEASVARVEETVDELRGLGERAALGGWVSWKTDVALAEGSGRPFGGAESIFRLPGESNDDAVRPAAARQ